MTYVVCRNGGYEGHSPPLLAIPDRETALVALEFLKASGESGFVLFEVPDWPKAPNKWWDTKSISPSPPGHYHTGRAKMTCKECQLLRVLPDADGKVRIRKGRAYSCTAKLENLRLPKSIRYFRPPVPGYMEPHEGEGCSYFVARTSVGSPAVPSGERKSEI